MATFQDIVPAPAGSKFVLQGNMAFALGVVHAGYHAADGYPGTPSTEVIDKGLGLVQDRIQVGWSVNEAVAVNVCLGRSIAGYDSVVTMKVPGVFQAGDAISTSAFFSGPAGALVIYAATDYVPSSTQHVIDARYFFASARLPVLEPRDHQEMYDVARTAADISRTFHTPVVVLASGILAHSEGLVVTKEPRTVSPRALPGNLYEWMLMPAIARTNYDRATRERIPALQEWIESSPLVNEIEGADAWGIITGGESTVIVREALTIAGANPSLLTLAAAYPFPKNRVQAFAKKIRGPLFVIEDGDTYLQERIRLLGIDVIGKDEHSTITTWSPEGVLELLSRHVDIRHEVPARNLGLNPVPRPPAICPGCSYRPLALTIAKLKRRKKLFAVFGDIGCSTLLHFIKALDTVACMGASDSMRQGFVMSRPEMANRTLSIIGDSCECHSGLDSTRNAVFRNVPGVKIILDNRITAMTGGQVAPSSELNLADRPHKFNLQKAIASEVERTIAIDAYDVKAVESALTQALDLAGKGVFSALILEGPCIQEMAGRDTVRSVEIDYELCKDCALCDVCPGIEMDDNKRPHFTSLCTNCGSNSRLCAQLCPFDAIVPLAARGEGARKRAPKPKPVRDVELERSALPDSLRVAIRGIGGQGSLFFGRVLSEVAMRTPYAGMNIVKGDTHGMAQLGGPVISTFNCGNVFSPVPAPNSVDVLVVMEISEALRPGFLDLLKPGGTILFNTFAALPLNVKKEAYPALADIEKALEGYTVMKIDASKIARELGDEAGRTANVVVLGVLSGIKPFDAIPEDIWLSALMSVSPNDFIKAMNQTAFDGGRKLFA